MATLKIKNISKKFNQNPVLENLSLEFESNKSYGIIGKSGSGKSTLLNLISGLDTPTSGEIYFNDMLISSLDSSKFLNKTIGLVFQQPHLLQELTSLENVIVKSLISNSNKDNYIKLGQELLDFVGLSDKANIYPNLLSGGEQQRIAIARALFNKPEFLIADEPTAHLDQETSKSIMQLLENSHKEWGLGLIISSHDPDIIKNLDIIYNIQKI